MTMDCSRLIQSLESLWFFTNVVSSRTPHAGNGTKEESTQPTSSILQTSLQNHDEHSPKHEFLIPKCAKCGDFADAGNGIKEESTQTTSSILQTSLQNHDEHPPKHEFLTPKCAKCGDFAAEIEEHDGDIKPIVTTEEVEIRKPTKREEKRKRRPRRKRSKRKILGELDLGFDRSRHCYRFDNGFGVFDDRETWRYGMFGRQLQHQVKMPPLNDGMAMKEHLKSWAYAVACTVR
ncbi:hypothetical protein NC653_027449 [Populus alba x Populus x berolinensis]|uniref:Uncharacterized protein n=1 Tax=Populus alba x Populus x berolinensis TaxID=444605 RepID=A0AAD6Q530_9ROSI|nr:hypothetical protein NC653_027449 [Populus alba x Populus x berolinensis]